MARRERHTQIGGQFAPRLIEMLESPAYGALSLSEHRLLARIEIELAHHGGTDNGRLPVTYDDFQQYGIDRHAISAAIRGAVALGFIEVTEPGRAGNADFRRPTLFRLTYRGAGRANPTNEWRRVETDQQALELARMARARNRKPVGVCANSQWENPHRKPQIHSGETHTTAHGGETHTTLDISGRGRQTTEAAAVVIPHPRAGAA